jgi:hypothetical protein
LLRRSTDSRNSLSDAASNECSAEPHSFTGSSEREEVLVIQLIMSAQEKVMFSIEQSDMRYQI